MHKLGVISDTHGLLRPEVVQALQGCEVILHGGDMNCQSILDELKRIAPVYVVRGNNDGDWAADIPETQRIELFGRHVYMIHDRKKLDEDMTGIDVVIFGHSHKYEENMIDGRLWLNPGSCGPRRFVLPVTMAILEIEDNGTYYVNRMDISIQSARKSDQMKPEEDRIKREKHGIKPEEQGIRSSAAGQSQEEDEYMVPVNIRDLIPSIMKDMDKGRPLKDIARRAGITYALAEQICRLYVTHPGVDVDGIMRRMGL